MTYHRIAGRTLREIDKSGDGLYASGTRVLFSLHEAAHAVAALAMGVAVERAELPRHGGNRVAHDRTVFGSVSYVAVPSDAAALVIAFAGPAGEALAHPDVRGCVPAFRAEDEALVRAVLARIGGDKTKQFR